MRVAAPLFAPILAGPISAEWTIGSDTSLGDFMIGCYADDDGQGMWYASVELEDGMYSRTVKVSVTHSGNVDIVFYYENRITGGLDCTAFTDTLSILTPAIELLQSGGKIMDNMKPPPGEGSATHDRERIRYHWRGLYGEVVMPARVLKQNILRFVSPRLPFAHRAGLLALSIEVQSVSDIFQFEYEHRSVRQ
jgi:hypothetical protein